MREEGHQAGRGERPGWWRHGVGAEWWPLALVIGCIAGAILLVDPRGNFPLNDDWNFALATWHFAETGEFIFSRFTAMSLKLQVVWGALWTFAFGESFTVLRTSSLVLGTAATVLVFALLGRVGVARPVRLLASLTFFFQPLFFVHAFTYMTHVPYVFVSAVALYLFYRAIAEDRFDYWVAGSIAALASCFIRQTGIVNLAVPLAAVLLGPGACRNRTRFLASGVGGLALFAVLYMLTDALTGYPGQINLHYELFEGGTGEVAGNLAETTIRWSVVTFQYGWLVFLPLTLPLFFEARRLGKTEWLAAAVILFPFIWVTNEMVVMHQAIPYHWGSNVLRNFAYGPLLLRDTLVFQLPFPRHLPYLPRIVMTYVASAGGALLILWLGRSFLLRRKDGSSVGVFVRLVTIHALSATAMLGISPFYFDRYVVDALWTVPLFLAVALTWTRARLGIGVALLVVVALLSISGTAEYLAWNQARWEAFAYLRSERIPMEEIDGGYEINQYLIGGLHGGSEMGKKGMAVIDDRFIITLQPVEGYEILKEFPYRAPLGWPSGVVYALQRTQGYERRLR